ncbi:MAG: hypothetical protein FWC19_09300 [Treponema sp.]|nr:hypothetical protein [Treponema sp.]MCL2272979.1 hypothetical protein [Treponema sp.]
MKIKHLLLVFLTVFIIPVSVNAGGNKERGEHNPVIQTDKNQPHATIDTRNLFATGGKGSLTINNQASFDVIIFAGRVSNNNVMGGIRAGQSRTFDLSTYAMPGKSGSFLVRAASFEQYNRKNARILEEDVIFTGLVVYNLNDSNDKTNLNIYAGVNDTGKEYIYASNTSKFVLELRLETPTGDKIATLAPLQENKKLFIKPKEDGMPYNFYATYVYVDPSTNEMRSFTARDRSERQRELPSTSHVAPLIFRGPQDTSQISYLVSFLRLKNETGEGLDLRDSGRILPDQKGRRFVSRGDMQTFELAALSGSAGQLYTNLYMEMDNTQVIRINRFSAKPGVVYDLVVTKVNGNYAYDIRETEYRDKLEDLQMRLFGDDSPF